MEIRINDAELQQALTRLAKNVRNTKPALQAIALYQERQLAKAFRENRSPDGTPWKPLSPNTVAQKKNTKMLVETIGRIPASLFSEATDKRVTVGYGDPLALIHHFGARIPARTIVPKNKRALFWAGASHPVKRVNVPATNLPARPLIGYSQKDIREWVSIIEDEIAGEFS